MNKLSRKEFDRIHDFRTPHTKCGDCVWCEYKEQYPGGYMCKNPKRKRTVQVWWADSCREFKRPVTERTER